VRGLDARNIQPAFYEKEKNMRKVHQNVIDLVGQRFTSLTVLKKSAYKPGGTSTQAYWDCMCDCGQIFHFAGQALRKGHAKRCKACGHPAARVIGAAANAAYAWYRCDARRKGKKRAVPFELTPEQFKALILRDCFYCGVEPLQTIKFPYETLFYNGIDRVDSNLGYVPENCVPCCKFCNYAKHNRSKEDFLTWLRRAYEHNYGKNN
jgi:hypothetical protein